MNEATWFQPPEHLKLLTKSPPRVDFSSWLYAVASLPQLTLLLLVGLPALSVVASDPAHLYVGNLISVCSTRRKLDEGTDVASWSASVPLAKTNTEWRNEWVVEHRTMHLIQVQKFQSYEKSYHTVTFK